MSFVCIRGSDDAVIGHTSTTSSPELPDYEVEVDPTITKFKPSFTKTKWTYDNVSYVFTNTQSPMTW